MRRRQFALEKQIASLTPKPQPIRLAVAVECALKGGYCPSCGNRVGRTVRTHYEQCGGLRVQ